MLGIVTLPVWENEIVRAVLAEKYLFCQAHFRSWIPHESDYSVVFSFEVFLGLVNVLTLEAHLVGVRPVAMPDIADIALDELNVVVTSLIDYSVVPVHPLLHGQTVAYPLS